MVFGPARGPGDEREEPLGSPSISSIPSATWQPQCVSGAHGFASPPHDGFAFVEDEKVKMIKLFPNAVWCWAWVRLSACIPQTAARHKARSSGRASQISQRKFSAKTATGLTFANRKRAARLCPATPRPPDFAWYLRGFLRAGEAEPHEQRAARQSRQCRGMRLKPSM